MAKTLQISKREELWMLKCGMERFLDSLKDDQQYCVKQYGSENPMVAEQIEKAAELLQRVEKAFKDSPVA